MSESPTLHLEIDAVWNKGAWWVVGGNGTLMFPLPRHFLTRKPRRRVADEMPSCEWGKWLGVALSRLRAVTAIRNSRPWDRRIASMVGVIRNRTVAPRSSNRKHIAGWEDCIERMRANCKQRSNYARAMCDEWTRWARTAASCGQKRAANRRRKGSYPEAITGMAGV